MSQFESIDRVLKKGRLELQEAKKFGPPPEDDGNENVKTETNRKRKKIVKKYGPKPETPKNVPPETNNNKPLTKHQKERQKIETKRKEYNLKPDRRGVYKPTKPGLKKSLEKQITYSSTPPKPSAKKTPEAIKKFNQQVRKSEKYSGNENQKRVKKLVDRAYKNQKIDKSKAGLVQRMKDIAYGKNPYKKKFGSTGLNVQKKYDKQMLEVGGRLNKLQTPKQLEKLKTKIASKPVEKTMTYLAPAGSGKPVPFKKPRKIKKILQRVYTPPKPELEKINPRIRKGTTTTTTPIGSQRVIKKVSQKEIEKLTRTVRTPVGNKFGDALIKNQTPIKIPAKEIEKIKPRITTSKNLGKISQTKLGSKIPSMQLSKRLMKSKNKYLAGAGLALAGGAYLLGNRRLKKAKEKERKALVIANTKKSQKPKELVDVSLFLNRTGTPPKTSKPSYNSVYDKDYIKNLKK